MTDRRWRRVESSPAGEHDLLVVDLDGVVYVGPDAVPGSVEALTAARQAGTAWVFATNNASRTPDDIAAHLRGLGLSVGPDDVVTSAQAGATLARERLGAGTRVLAVGGEGVAVACRQAGLEIVRSADDAPAAVVQGYGPGVAWTDLAEATVAVRAGALWIATNTDMTIPTARGVMPGNGSLVAAVAAAVGVEPLVAGKPQPHLFTTAARHAGAEHPLVIGDRLDTDVAGAVAAHQTSLLTLTGVTRPADLLRCDTGHRPDLVAVDLGGLHQAHPDAVRDGDAWTCGRGRARWDDGRLVGTGEDGDAGALDLLRAACAAAWERVDAGAVAGADVVAEPHLEARWAGLGSVR